MGADLASASEMHLLLDSVVSVSAWGSIRWVVFEVYVEIRCILVLFCFASKQGEAPAGTLSCFICLEKLSGTESKFGQV